jgi:DNA replication and repair protein RecF
MYVAHLSLTDFRSYPSLEVDFFPGVNALVGQNGAGKTNIIEAIGYMSALASHRVGGDGPLIRSRAERGVISVSLTHGERAVNLAVEIASGRPAPALVNGVQRKRRRDVGGILRSVIFAPEDLALVKGDPDIRRRFIDNLLIQRSPRWVAELADYERVAKQRATLLKSLGGVRRAGRVADLRTLEVWTARLADHGARIAVARQDVVAALEQPTREAYGTLAADGRLPELTYAAAIDDVVPREQSVDDDEDRVMAQRDRLSRAMALLRDKEIERGVNLAGPHRDDLRLFLGDLPARGYASHGESWSLALALKLGAFEVLRDGNGGSPVLILDDVFAELDTERRTALASMAGVAEQVFVTVAVPGDIPDTLKARVYTVAGGQVHHAD